MLLIIFEYNCALICYFQHQLPGFYDPCPGEDKSLYVKYLFHAVVHQVTIKDKEGLRIPKQCELT